jgi:RNA polymerase sigma-70 factor (ECF subfamily)
MTIELFDSLFESHWQLVYSTAFKRLANAEKAIEVTQEAFFQLWQHKDEIVSENVITFFLLTVLQNEISKMMEKDCRCVIEPVGKLFKFTDLPFAN